MTDQSYLPGGSTKKNTDHPKNFMKSITYEIYEQGL